MILRAALLAVACSAYDYPAYCLHYPFPSTLRAAQPLKDKSLASTLVLDHVHLLFRHGARTPMPLGQCWKNYAPHWDCDYTESVQGGLGTDAFPSATHTLLLKRVYDARGGENNLGGTCQCEQLLSEGALQHQRIGRLVAENYLISDSPKKLPYVGSPSLLDTSLTHLSSQLYLRSTETERTTHSLLNQLQAMIAHFIRREALGAKAVSLNSEDGSPASDSPVSYQPQHRIWTKEEIQQELNLHDILRNSLPALNTMDSRFDTMTATVGPCPLLDGIAKEILQSPEFAAIRTNNQPIIDKWQSITGVPLHDRMWPVQPWDCAISHVCANRWAAMPEGLSPNSVDAEGAGLFLMDLERAATSEVHGLYGLRNAVFSRFGIGGLLSDIRKRMLITLREAPDDPTRPRLHMWSTHDDGIAPLLFAMLPSYNPPGWVPYASLISLEIYRNHGVFVPNESIAFPGYYIRVVYNGLSLTNHAAGCTEELCPLDSFLTGISWCDAANQMCEDARQEERKRASFVPFFPYPSSATTTRTAAVSLGEELGTFRVVKGPPLFISCAAVVTFLPLLAFLRRRKKLGATFEPDRILV